MKLYSFRIQNYKSIKDSGICYVEDKITVFAGKNGSGKSNVLEALSKFSTQEFNYEEDNFNYENEQPIVTTIFKLEKNEIDEISKKYGINLKELVTICLDTNDNKNFEYSVNFESDLDRIREKNKLIITRISKEAGIKDLKNADSVELVIEPFGEDLKNTIIETLDKFKYTDINKLIDEIENDLLERMPEFVYQKTVANELKSEMSLESIKKNEFHKDIYKLMNLNEADFNQDKDKSWRCRRGDMLSQELTGNFGEFFKQNRVELNFSFDGDKIVMSVKEPDKASKYENKIENKSDGLRWFIAFYAKLNVTKSKNVIILLDEPGMYLHANACKGMLKIFDDISNESQILLATHNPYLIDAKKISNVRLVLNETDKSTIIENKPHKYGQDTNMDALTPILTSIGCELTMSIHVGNQKNNLITEGISDYYYLQGMAKLLNIKFDYHIIPSSSADKINYIASILIGWGLNTIALIDSDKKGKEKEKELKPLVDKCIFVSEKENESVEDLFTKEEYCKLILELDSICDCKNSKVKKEIQIDEILKAKQFIDKVNNNEIIISDITKERFKRLFTKIKEEFGSIMK